MPGVGGAPLLRAVGTMQGCQGQCLWRHKQQKDRVRADRVCTSVPRGGGTVEEHEGPMCLWQEEDGAWEWRGNTEF